MTKKMKREKTPTPVSDEVAESMEVRLAYQTLIDSFAGDQAVLEERIKAHSQDSEDSEDSEDGDSQSGNNAN